MMLNDAAEDCSYCRLKDLMRKIRKAGGEELLVVDGDGRTHVHNKGVEGSVTRVGLIAEMLEDHCVC